MPLMFLHYPEASISETSLPLLVGTLTEIGMECEGEPDTPSMRNANWLFVREYPKGRMFVGGTPSGKVVFTLEVRVFSGAMNDSVKETMVSRMTQAVGEHMQQKNTAPPPVYVLIHEVAPANWGVSGERITLNDLRNPPDQVASIS